MADTRTTAELQAAVDRAQERWDDLIATPEQREQKRARVAAAALMQEPSFVDALLDSSMSWVARRALACTCTPYAHKMAEYFARPTLLLYPHDCSDDTFQFLVEQLLKKANPNVSLVFCDDAEGTKRSEPLKLRDWMFHHYPISYPPDWIREGQGELAREAHAERVHKALTTDDITRLANQKDYYPSLDEYTSLTECWFLGRTWAAIPNGARMRMTLSRPARRRGQEINEELFVNGIVSHPNYLMPKPIYNRLNAKQMTFLAGCYLVSAQAKVEELIGLAPDEDKSVTNNRHYLDDPGIEALLKQMRTGDLKITHLRLWSSVTSISNGFLTPLAAGRMDTTRLTSLTVAHASPLLGCWRNQLVATLGAVQPWLFPRLKHLTIKNAAFTDANLVALAPSFGLGGSLCGLESLCLDQNPITHVGLGSFALFAMDMPNLETLCLQRVSVTRSDILHFAKTIKDKAHWPYILSVYLTGRGFDTHGRAAVLLQRAVHVVHTRAQLDKKIAEAIANPNADAHTDSDDTSDSDDSAVSA